MTTYNLDGIMNEMNTILEKGKLWAYREREVIYICKKNRVTPIVSYGRAVVDDEDLDVIIDKLKQYLPEDDIIMAVSASNPLFFAPYIK